MKRIFRINPFQTPLRDIFNVEIYDMRCKKLIKEAYYMKHRKFKLLTFSEYVAHVSVK